MYAVGVGKAVEEELREIASEPAELHVSYSPDFGTMTHLLENLKGSICPGEHIRLGSLPLLPLPNLGSLPRLLTPQPFHRVTARAGPHWTEPCYSKWCPSPAEPQHSHSLQPSGVRLCTRTSPAGCSWVC